ncbi:MAG: tRNA-guanine transglycosylase, partial [Actinomycetota bacterium]
FDYVTQTQLSRHGTALAEEGRLQLKSLTHATDDGPVDPECPCDVCRRHSRGYLRHLFQVNEPTAARLLSLHNVAWTLDLMSRMRTAIVESRFQALRREILEVWS